MKIFKKDHKIGLALGGGSILGAAHIGVLKAFEELDIPISYISGTSIGSFIASLYAFGKTPDEIEKIMVDLKWMDVSKISPSKFGLLSNERVKNVIEKTLGDVNIGDSKIPLSIVATDITSGKKVLFQRGNLIKAIRASTCIPGVFTPIEINGRMLVDGGVVENVPVTSLKKMGAKYIIGVDLLAKYAHKKPKNILEVLLHTFNYMITNSSQRPRESANLIIELDLNSFNKISTKQVKNLVKKGFEESIYILEKKGFGKS